MLGKKNLLLQMLERIKAAKYMFLIALLFVTSTNQGCVERNKGNHVAKQAETVAPTDTLTPFEIFSKDFIHKEVPYEIGIGSDDWIDFTDKEFKEISRDNVIKFLCNNEKKCVEQPTGGFYQYYYGYSLKFNDITGLIYYRTATDYIGFVLSTFNSMGALQSTLFLSGVKGEFDPEAQKEAVIKSDGVIEVKEIVMGNDVDYSGKVFYADLVISNYIMNAQGEIVELSKSSKVKVKVKCDKNQRHRIVLI